MQFVTPKEADLINAFAKGNTQVKQPIIDILSEYSIFETLNQNNALSLVAKAAKVALIKLPCFSFQSLVKGMGSFWRSVTEDMFASIFDCMVPSEEDLISCITPNECNQKDQKITTWLHRYIRSCTKIELFQLVRFITGSASFPPKTSVKLEFTDQPINHLRPLSKTCFKILILPRQYLSFTHLSDNLNLYLNNKENWNVHDEDFA